MKNKETLEELAEKLQEEIKYGASISDIIDTLTKWQQQRSFSEEEIKQAFKVGFSIGYGSDVHAIDEKNRTCDEWFEQFKKK